MAVTYPLMMAIVFRRVIKLQTTPAGLGHDGWPRWMLGQLFGLGYEAQKGSSSMLQVRTAVTSGPLVSVLVLSNDQVNFCKLFHNLHRFSPAHRYV